MKLHFFIGSDSKEDIAYRVCKHPLLKRSSIDVSVLSLKLDELIANNLYTRNVISKIKRFIPLLTTTTQL